MEGLTTARLYKQRSAKSEVLEDCAIDGVVAGRLSGTLVGKEGGALEVGSGV